MIPYPSLGRETQWLYMQTEHESIYTLSTFEYYFMTTNNNNNYANVMLSNRILELHSANEPNNLIVFIVLWLL